MLLDIDLGDGRFLVFGTPVLRYVVPDTAEVNARLHDILLAREKQHPEFRTGKLNRSNLGGWRSEPDLLRWPEPEMKVLRGWMEGAVEKMLGIMRQASGKSIEASYAVTAWANINRDGSYNVAHDHAGQHFSGVYYVSSGKPDPERLLNGWFEFADPRPAASPAPVPAFEFGQKMTINPTPGMIMMFPSWMVHSVHPFFGEGERISIAFNVRFKEMKRDGAPIHIPSY
jgi:uncharacterized protein (TIGR02466 family)